MDFSYPFFIGRENSSYFRKNAFKFTFILCYNECMYYLDRKGEKMDNRVIVHFHSMNGEYSKYSMWRWLDGYWGKDAFFQAKMTLA